MCASALDQFRAGAWRQLGHGKEFTSFSESPLWSLQRQYYRRLGVDAWLNGERPYYAASNQVLARAYAEVIVSYWEDLLVQDLVDIREPLYVLESGSAAGLFTHALMLAIDDCVNTSAFPDLNWCCLASDIVEANLQFIEQHHRFMPWIQENKLKTISFDFESSASFKFSGSELAITALRNPLVVVANHVFSSLTQDLFHSNYGKLYRCLCAVERVNDQAEGDEFFANLHVSYDWRLVEDNTEVPLLYRSLVTDYVKELPSAPLLLPSGALQGLDKLSTLSRGRMLVLAQDRGEHQLSQLRLTEVPYPIAQGGFHFPVNFHALSAYTQSRQGTAVCVSGHGQNLVNCALLFAAPEDAFGHTFKAFDQHFAAVGCDDFLHLHAVLDRCSDDLTLDQWLAYLRFCRFDTVVFMRCLPLLLSDAVVCSAMDRQRWVTALQSVWRAYYDLDAAPETISALMMAAVKLHAWAVLESALLEYRYCFGEDDNYRVYRSALLSNTGRLPLAIELMAQDPSDDLVLLDYERSLLGRYQQSLRHDRYVLDVADDGLLCLEPLSPVHADALIEQYRDPSIAVQARLPELRSASAVKAWLRHMARTGESRELLSFAVLHRQHGFIGVVGARCSADLGYFHFWIGVDFQGQGFAQQVIALFFKQAAHLGLRCLYTSVYQHNFRSLQALRSAGFECLPVQATDAGEALLFFRYPLLIMGDVSMQEKLAELGEFLLAIDSPLLLQESASGHGHKL